MVQEEKQTDQLYQRIHSANGNPIMTDPGVTQLADQLNNVDISNLTGSPDGGRPPNPPPLPPSGIYNAKFSGSDFLQGSIASDLRTIAQCQKELVNKVNADSFTCN